MIYVDACSSWLRGMRMAHLVADSDEELEAFARRLGLKPGWRHGDHYDVTQRVRAKAIRMGARAVTARDLVAVRRRRRQVEDLVRREKRIRSRGKPPNSRNRYGISPIQTAKLPRYLDVLACQEEGVRRYITNSMAIPSDLLCTDGPGRTGD